MARQGIIPRVFGWVHPKRRTPLVAIVFTSGIAFVLIACIGDLTHLAATTVSLLLLAFTLVNISVLVLRKDKVKHKHFQVPSWLPIFGTVTCVGLVIFKATEDPKVMLIAAGLLAVGVLFWFINRWYHGRIRQFDTKQLETFSA